jgi:hypothetical protein
MPKDTPEWEWILCESPSLSNPFAPLKKLGTLDSAKNRSWTPQYNRAGACGFQIRTKDPLAGAIMDKVDLGDIRGTVKKCVRLRRNGIDMWSGQIWGIDGTLSGGTLTISCVGWLETLQKRILWQTADYSNGGNGLPTDQIIFGVMNLVDSQNAYHPLLIKPGSVTGGMPIRNRYYTLGTSLGPTIQELSDIEAGVNYSVDPVTRALNLSSWDSYTDHKDIVLGYGWGPNNLQDVTWQEDASKTCNYMGISTSLGSAPVYVDDPYSQDQYNLFEENNQLTGANENVLVPYGVAELVIRSRPLLTYSLKPHPRTGTTGPSLFDDFQIGDQIYFSAVKDYVKIKKQAVRVFGATVNIDDVGNETISTLQTSPSA